ncbi:MAG: co-chaperone GroES [Bdellovibrio sp.]
MQVVPLQDRVLVERFEEEKKTAGGIIIPDNNSEKPSQGKVVSVGKGYRLQDGTVRALDVKAGDKILFGKYSGTEVKVEGKDYLIMREDDILGIIQ